ncbi:MAG TPA: YihY/virulence factor BrkB family protein [Solirubrobacteraceae bacterium]|nr:YihY/virulence factor BrkB family protein [Solirubrobacteraceae bacterium]
MSVMQKVDAAQKRLKPTSVAVATFKKFSEDKTTTLAATIAFWGFFSIFPLFLVLVTVLGWVLPASEKANVLKHVAAMFPLLDPSTIKGLTGSWWALLLGALTALWSGLGAVRAVQNAFNSVWEIPYHERPGLLEQLGRSLLVLLTIGAGIVVTTLISGFVTGNSTGVNLGVAGRIAGLVISIALDVGLFVAAFRLLTDREVGFRDVLAGAVFSGIVFFILQELSAFIIARHLKSAQPTYGRFATVITILWWFYLQSVVTLLGAQLNVVLKERLYPRSLVQAPQTEADHRVLQAYAEERTYQPEETVRTKVEKERATDGPLRAGR